MIDQEDLDIQFINELDPLLEEIDNYFLNQNYETSNNLVGGSLSRLYTVSRDQTFNESNQYSIKHRVIEFNTNNNLINDFVSANIQFRQFIIQICSDYIETLKPKTKVKFTLDHNSFQFPLQFPFIFKEQLTPELICMRLESIIQSRKNDLNYSANNNDKITIILKIAQNLRGGCSKPLEQKSQTYNAKYKRKKQVELKLKEINKILPLRLQDAINIDEYIDTKSSIIKIYNDDNYCLLRAVLIGIAYITKNQDIIKIFNKKSLEFTNYVLFHAKNLMLENEPSGHKDISKIENYFEDFQIMVIDKNYQCKSHALYLNENKEFNKFIYILYNNNHYHFIKSIKSYLNRVYYCDFCKIGFNTINSHSCLHLCKACRRSNNDCKLENNYSTYCDNCCTRTKNYECSQIHVKKKGIYFFFIKLVD
jgi:hypothetical protein